MSLICETVKPRNIYDFMGLNGLKGVFQAEQGMLV